MWASTVTTPSLGMVAGNAKREGEEGGGGQAKVCGSLTVCVQASKVLLFSSPLLAAMRGAGSVGCGRQGKAV